VFSAGFALDHFSLNGLSQGFGMDLNKYFGLEPTLDKNGLCRRLHYAYVANPIMTGFLVMMVSAPLMSASRLLFGVTMGAYCVLATKFLEEPYLEKLIGEPYTDYLASVPSFCPFTSPSRSSKKLK
jgi:protein-S-isoprenylcysteine O-methyltransferase Ste14